MVRSLAVYPYIVYLIKLFTKYNQKINHISEISNVGMKDSHIILDCFGIELPVLMLQDV